MQWTRHFWLLLASFALNFDVAVEIWMCHSVLDKIEVHPGHCYLRAKHGREQSEEHEFKR